MNIPLAEIKQDMDVFFNVFNEKQFSHIDFEGGETMLHPELPQIIEHGLVFVEQGVTDEVRVLTNATILPNKELLDICKNNKVMFLIDDYGPNLSDKKDKLINILENNGIRYRVDTYHGDNQYCGGWIDFGNLSVTDETEPQFLEKFKNCISKKNAHTKNGNVYICPVQLSEPPNIDFHAGDYLNLHCDMPLSEKRAWAKEFAARPANHCRYCNGFMADGGGVRIPAAEQLDIITPVMRDSGRDNL